MPRKLSGVFTVAVCLLLAAAVAAEPVPTAPVHKKRHATRHWHGYGFLPGYRPPEVIERERAAHYYRVYGPQYYVFTVAVCLLLAAGSRGARTHGARP